MASNPDAAKTGSDTVSSTALETVNRDKDPQKPPNPDADKIGSDTASGAALETVNRHKDPQKLLLWASWFCPFVQRPFIALEEKGLAYQYKEENPYKKDASFLRVNPRGLVPAIEYEGKALYESLVLLEFLDDLDPTHSLRSTESPIEAAYERLAIDEISKKVVPAFYKILQASEEGEKRDEARKAYVDALNEFASRWFRGPWIRGDRFGVVDVALAPWAARMWLLEKHRAFDLKQLDGGLAKWFKEVLERDSVKNTTSADAQVERAYARYLSNEAQSEVARATRSGANLP